MRDCGACLNCAIPGNTGKLPPNFRHFCLKIEKYLVSWVDKKDNTMVIGIKDAETCEHFKLYPEWKLSAQLN